MRISQNMITNDLLQSLNKNRNQLALIQNQVSTGKVVNKPSDGPLAYTSSAKLDDLLRNNQQYQKNVTTGLHQARAAQEALDITMDKIIQLKALVVQGANDKVIEARDMEILATQVTALKEDLVDLFNTQTDGRYIFAGTNTLTQPFEIDENGDVQYNGNSDTIKSRVNDNMEVELSLTGNTLSATPAGNLFEMLTRIQTHLENGDSNALNGELRTVDDLVSHFGEMNARVGTNINRLDFVYEQFEVSNINIQSEVSRLVDTDYAEALSRIQALQVAYQASLSANASLLQTSLLNFLR